MTQDELLRGISFDLYERYRLLEPIAKLFRPSGSTYKVLDVGGHTPASGQDFRLWPVPTIPDADVTVVDMHLTAELRNYVQASGTALPFRDGAFDLVCSLDTLKHIPEERRAAFLTELLRVTRDGLYVAFPFDSATNRWAESLVVGYTSVALKRPVQPLLEHRQFGLPDRDRVAKVFADASHPWIGFAQGSTDVWLLMMLTYQTLLTVGADFVNELNRRFNQVYAPGDWSEPCHRAGYLLSKTRRTADLESVRSSFASTRGRTTTSGANWNRSGASRRARENLRAMQPRVEVRFQALRVQSVVSTKRKR